jgi:hypothetical protein
MMRQFVRILTAIFWVAAPLSVAALLVAFLSYDFMVGVLSYEGLSVVNAVLIGTVMVCSGLIAAYEFWLNPLADTERGEWTGRQLFYGFVFTITFFLSCYFIPIAFVALFAS